MSIKINRADGTESLNNREPFLRFYEEGQLSSSGSLEDNDGKLWYRYTVPIPVDIQGKTVFVYIKSDFDEFFCDTEEDNFYFYSELNTSKQYKIYANYSFESYSVSTNYGAKILDPSGNVLYDSRVPEAVYLDHFVVTNDGGPYFHSATSEAWYSVSTYSARFRLQCGTAPTVPGGFISRFLIQTLKQVSSNKVESGLFVSKEGIIGCTTRENSYTFPIMLLDPQYI